MKRTKKLLALCLCTSVATANVTPMTINAKTLKDPSAASFILSDATVTTLASKLQPQTMQILASEASEFTYDTNGVSTITITGYSGSASELVIPDTIDGYTVTKIGERVFEQNTNLSNVILPAQLVSIEDFAFFQCTNLKSIVVPDSGTSIGDKAFFGCSSLASVELPSNLTTMGYEAFGKCVALSSITIPKSLITYDSISSGPFNGCTHLYTATIEEGATTVCKRLFYGCAVETVSLPSTVKSIENYAFYECTNLKNIVVPDSVTSIEYQAFYGCSSLASVELSSNLTTMGYEAFGDCVALSSITIPKSLITYDSYSYGPFRGCTHLYTATIEEGATTVCSRLFYDCAVETVSLPSTLKSVEDYAFYECTNLKKIYFSCNAPTIADKSFYSVTATAYYPSNNSTWTSNAKQNYGGKLTWTTWTPAITPAPGTPIPVATATAKPTTSPVVTVKPTTNPTTSPVVTVKPTAKPTATTGNENVPDTQTTISDTTVSKVTVSTTKKKVTLRWKKKAGVTGYQIYRKTGSEGYKLVKTIKKAKTVKWTDTSVQSGKTYRYKIRAYRVGNGKMSYSKFSSVKKVKVK